MVLAALAATVDREVLIPAGWRDFSTCGTIEAPAELYTDNSHGPHVQYALPSGVI